MKGKIYIIAAIAIILVVIVVVVEKPFSQRSVEESTPDSLEAVKRIPVFDKVSAEDSFKIQVFQKDDQTSVTLTKDNVVWYVNPERKYPASKVNITRLFNTLKDIKDGEVVSNNPQNHVKFQLDEAASTRVKFYGKSEDLLADVFVGKAGTNYMSPSSYVRKSGSDEVLLVNGFLTGIFSATDESWRERSILDYDPALITSFIIKEPGKPEIKLARLASDQWTCLEPKSFMVRQDVAGRMVNSFAKLRASAFISDYPQKPYEEYGLGPDAFSVTATFKDYSTTPTLYIGKESEGKRTQWYVRAGEQETVYLIYKYTRDSMVKTLEELEPTPTPTPSQTEVSMKEQMEEEAKEKKEEIDKMTVEEKNAAVQKKLDEILKNTQERQQLKKEDQITSPPQSSNQPVLPTKENE